MDYYRVLGVEYGASPDDIKKAYREKARQYHPDYNPSPDATERFREVVEAYNALIEQARLHPKQATNFTSTADRPFNINRKPSPAWEHRKRMRRRNANFFHIGLLILGFFVVFGVAQRTFFLLYFGWQAQETTCTAESWQSSGGRQRLTYTVDVPWQSVPLQQTRSFNEVRDEFAIGSTFPCFYYDGQWQEANLWRYDTSILVNMTPWAVVGLLIFGQAIRHFLRR